MPDQPNEVIELIFYPQERMDMTQFINALYTLNVDYRRWLKEHGENPNDAELRLYLEKVTEGSIKLWLTKAGHWTRDVLIDFGKDFFVDKLGSLIRGDGKNLALDITELRNKLSFFNSNKNSKIEFNLLKFEKHQINAGNGSYSSEEISRGAKNIKEILGKQRQKVPGVVIKFQRFDITQNARVVCEDLSPDAYAALMPDNVRAFFIKQDDSLFHKEYQVDLEVQYEKEEIQRYVIERILAS